MKLFLDTSSLIKKYIEESGSDKLISLIMEANEVTISPITKIEFFSALSRLLHTGYIDKESYRIASHEFEIDYKDFNIILFQESIENLALELLRTYNLKTLDSIQLASVKQSESSKFVTSDKNYFSSKHGAGVMIRLMAHLLQNWKTLK
ncbi:MAG: PIN domain-containing protein [Spirochaetia bacterium]|nr:PIN domain-containing protein [Spirochaetia bacterium]